ncbi:MAG: hypothetical protein GY906_08610 [bacterium]|nr:hypothetical protein [bacterium]
MAGRKRNSETPASYRLTVQSWDACYSSSGGGHESEDFLSVDLGVCLSHEANGVSSGDITVYGSSESRGGYLGYDTDKRLGGALFVGVSGVQALLSLLAGDRIVVLDLTGSEFKYRKAPIRGIGIYSTGHLEDVEDDTNGKDRTHTMRKT